MTDVVLYERRGPADGHVLVRQQAGERLDRRGIADQPQRREGFEQPDAGRRLAGEARRQWMQGPVETAAVRPSAGEIASMTGFGASA